MPPWWDHDDVDVDVDADVDADEGVDDDFTVDDKALTKPWSDLNWPRSKISNEMHVIGIVWNRDWNLLSHLRQDLLSDLDLDFIIVIPMTYSMTAIEWFEDYHRVCLDRQMSITKEEICDKICLFDTAKCQTWGVWRVSCWTEGGSVGQGLLKPAHQV